MSLSSAFSDVCAKLFRELVPGHPLVGEVDNSEGGAMDFVHRRASQGRGKHGVAPSNLPLTAHRSQPMPQTQHLFLQGAPS